MLYFILINNKNNLFDSSYSKVIFDKDSILISAHIADDEQWRFPNTIDIPHKFVAAITTFEDKRFFYHNGIDPIAIFRALVYNYKNKKVVSGGSTLTMQVIRLSRKGKNRTYLEKIIEFFLATKLEITHSKNEILSLYASNAPFGGNIVGLETASWRYFNRSGKNLTWAEASLLAVLPNSPSLIHLSKNRHLLKIKRNNLLKKLYLNEVIDKEEFTLSIYEPLPRITKPFTNIAYHLLNKKSIFDNNIAKTTIDYYLQARIKEIAENHISRLSDNSINNTAIIVSEVNSGKVRAYIGNVNIKNTNNNYFVDIATSERSTGSLLKPFLYASMINSGEIMPNSLVADIPTHIRGYAPKNFSLDYRGAVPSKKALSKSLNIPAVLMLKEYGLSKFISKLKKLGMNSLHYDSDYYGLALILGGSEGSLFNMVGMYASMARILNNYNKTNKYYENNIRELSFKEINYSKEETETSTLSASSIYLTFDAMLDVERPNEYRNWEYFSSTNKIAWKTGTSFGFRDGWAIGITPEYVVGVWVGNADGEGRPNLTGIKAAAPILFDIFGALKLSGNWFSVPNNDLIEVNVCTKSGLLATDLCKSRIELVPKNAKNHTQCKYHKLISVDENGNLVNNNCEKITQIIRKPWFILPPIMEYYYKKKNSDYEELPRIRKDCKTQINNNIEIIYPKELTKIYVPIDLGGKAGETIFEAVHRNTNTSIYWHIDDKFITETNFFHHIAVNPSKGKHKLTLIDSNGEVLSRNFEIISK